MPIQAICSSRIVDRDQTLPLLYGERFAGVKAQAYGLALRIEGVKINVSDHSKRTIGGPVDKGGQLFVREA